jgi:demethylmenaquinone methyltransferase/2-methoxy-6-polyprenyl-1,4-benzoquinol methylase
MLDPEGRSIGRIEAIYLDYETDAPEWALVTQGRFGSRPIFVPLEGVTAEAEALRAPFGRDAVSEAPAVEPDDELSQDAEAALTRHYGLGGPPARTGRGADRAPGAAGEGGPAEHGVTRRAHRAQPGDLEAGTAGTEPSVPRAGAPESETAPAASPTGPGASLPGARGGSSNGGAPAPASSEAGERQAPDGPSAAPRETAAEGTTTPAASAEAEAAWEAPAESSVEDEEDLGVLEDQLEPLEEEHVRRLEQSRERYRLHAPTYDFQTTAIQPARERAVPALELQPGDVVLDVGCGTGNAFDLIEERIGPEGRLIGIDLSPDMLSRAERRVAAAGWKNVELIEGSAEEATFKGPVDAVLFAFTHDILRSPRALKNIMRHVRPGGRVVATGAKWAPWWAPAVNSYVVTIAASYVSSFEGFDRPWSQLECLVPDLQIEDLSFGSAYLATGRLPERS